MMRISAGIFPTGNDVRPQARVQSMLASTQNEEPPAPVGGFTALPAEPPPKMAPPAPVITVEPAIPAFALAPAAPAAPPRAAPEPPVVSAGPVPAKVQPTIIENAAANESCHFIANLRVDTTCCQVIGATKENCAVTKWRL